MKYEIKQSHVLWNNDGIQEIAVLWADGDDLRATYADTIQKVGYESIKPNDAITMRLLQRVAGYGVYLDAERKKTYFPNVKNWSR